MRLACFPTVAFVDIRPSRVLQPDGSPSPRSDYELLYLPTARESSFRPSFKTIEVLCIERCAYCRRHDCILSSWTHDPLERLAYLYYRRRNIKIKVSTTGEKKTSDNDPSYDCARGLVQEKPPHLLSSSLARRIKAPPVRDWNARPEDSGRVTVNGLELEVADVTELGDKPVLQSDLYEARGKDGLAAWKSGPGRSK